MLLIFTVWAVQTSLRKPPVTAFSPTFQLMFHVDNGAGRFTALYDAGIPGRMCNGLWHKVTARKIKNRLELVVDGSQVDAESPNSASTSADTNDPVFVGGFPGECWLHQRTCPSLLMFVVFQHFYLYSCVQECVLKGPWFRALESPPINNTWPEVSSL